MTATILQVENLSVYFSIKQPNAFWGSRTDVIKAVDNISLTINSGEILGVVGESGSGKSTLARAIIGLEKPSSGKIWLNQMDLTQCNGKQLKMARKYIQMIFQDPFASLDPRMNLGNIIAEPLKIFFPELNNKQRTQRAQQMLEKVGLSVNLINRYPHEFSGGQCQRIGIARALVVEPQLLICDEPTTSLDMTIQAQIIELLKKINADLNMSILLITHDLRIVSGMCDHVLVMKSGQQVEYSTTKEIFTRPQSTYTQELLASIPLLPSLNGFE